MQHTRSTDMLEQLAQQQPLGKSGKHAHIVLQGVLGKLLPCSIASDCVASLRYFEDPPGVCYFGQSPACENLRLCISHLAWRLFAMSDTEMEPSEECQSDMFESIHV